MPLIVVLVVCELLIAAVSAGCLVCGLWLRDSQPARLDVANWFSLSFWTLGVSAMIQILWLALVLK